MVDITAEPEVIALLAELPAEVSDVDLDEVVVERVAPQPVEDRFLREHLTGVTEEQLEQLVFARGQLDRGVAPADLVRELLQTRERRRVADGEQQAS